MTTDGYVEHIVKTKTSAGIMVLIVLGAFITVVGAFFMFFVPGGAIFGLPLAVVGVIIFSLAINRKECEFEYLFVMMMLRLQGSPQRAAENRCIILKAEK